jgi:hypothetical protein
MRDNARPCIYELDPGLPTIIDGGNTQLYNQNGIDFQNGPLGTNYERTDEVTIVANQA